MPPNGLLDPNDPDEQVSSIVPSLVRPSDADYRHGQSPSPYRQQADLLESEKDIHDNKAMAYLQKALANQAEISPSQGIAAALLAAVPTLGGYLIGKHVGTPNIPEGDYFRGVGPEAFNKEFGVSGANVGGLEGSQIGDKASSGFLGGIQKEVTDRLPVYEKMAALESRKSDSLENRANQLDLAGLNADETNQRQQNQFEQEKQLIPLREQSTINIAKETEQYRKSADSATPLSDTEKEYWSQKLGIPRDVLTTKGDISLQLRQSHESGLGDRQDKKFAQVGEKSAMEIAGPVAIGKDVNQSVGELQKALGSDPSLLNKAFSSLPLGSDAYNAMAQLKINGARAAKQLEGRVNDTTLQLYTNLLTSLDTEPLSAVVKRSERFTQALNDDAKFKLNALSATGKDVNALKTTLGLNENSSSGGLPSIGSNFQGSKVLSITKVK